VSTSNDIFNEVLRRSAADLNILITNTEHGPYPYAGIPWYSTTFGRDGIIAAMQVLWCYPELAKGVLMRLARLQATDVDAFADSEPGKILHEMRAGEMAALREVPFGLYYGSVDSTPLFVLLAGMYLERSGDITFIQTIWPNIKIALNWIDGAGDPDRDGFVEYQRQNENGLVNQGWKDSFDSVFHSDGTLAKGPIALCEVQGYVYAAKKFAARMAAQLGEDALAEILKADAATLADRFDAAFWCPELGTYALALDGEKRQCKVCTSNAGQVLMSGIASSQRADAVAQNLFTPSMYSGWGIRTLAGNERRYNPMSYHNGSVWPHDNSLIAFGLAQYGHRTSVGRLLESVFDAASYMDLRRLPELYCGFARARGRGPTLYPVACAPQAWAAGAPLLMLQAMLGLEFDVTNNEIILRNPRLPSFMDSITLTNLRIEGCQADLYLHKDGLGVSVKILRNEGGIQIRSMLS
jgi:glycogen debranching enzyme